MRKLFLTILFLFIAVNFIYSDITSYNILKKKAYENIKYAGKKKNDIIKFLKYYKDKEKQEAAFFLVANSGLSDLATFDAKIYKENIDYAFKAWKNFPWGKNVSKELFFHFVLPLHSSQEPVQRWRKKFYETLLPKLKNKKTLTEAISVVNHWSYQQFRYEPTARWDWGPLDVEKSGYGRCEEDMIFYMAVARSVGIPVRQAYTPYWPFTDSNHAWVEVYTEKGWLFGDAGGRSKLGHTWFGNSTKKTAFVKSTAFGFVSDKLLNKMDDTIYLRKNKYTILNSISHYADIVNVKIKLENTDGTPFKGRFFLSLYNFGILRPVASFLTDKNGVAAFSAGKVDLVLSAENKKGEKIVTLLPLHEGENSKKFSFKLKRNVDFSSFSGWIRSFNKFKNIAETDKSFNEIDDLKKENLELKRIAINRDALKFFSFFCNNKKFIENLYYSKANFQEIAKAFSEIKNEEDRKLFVRYISSMNKKDMVKLDKRNILDNIEVLKKILKIWHIEDEKIVNDYVIAHRIYAEEWKDYKKYFWNKYKKFIKRGDVEKSIKLLGKKVFSKIKFYPKELRTMFSPFMAPISVDITGYVTGEHEKSVYEVAILRSLGIPSKVAFDIDSTAINYYNGKKWIVYSDKEIKNKENITYKKIEIDFYKNNVPFDAKFYRDFALATFENGYFHDIDYTVEPKKENNSYIFSLPERTYYLIYGTRNIHGEPFFRMCKVDLSKTEKIKIDFALPLNILKPEDFIETNKINFAVKEIKSKKYLIAYLDMGSEKSISTFNALMNVKNKLRNMGLSIYVVSKDTTIKNIAKKYGVNYIIDNGKLLKKCDLKNEMLPLIAIVDNGKIIFWMKGFNLNIDNMVMERLKMK